MKHNNSKNTFILSVVILSTVLLVGLIAVISLTRYEQKRDLNDWQITLSVMADSKVSEIDKWVGGRFDVLQELAANGALQMYVHQLLREPQIGEGEEAVELSYLNNLIKTTGLRGGFFDDMQSNIQVRANVSFHANNGLVLLAAGKQVITATPGFYGPDPKLVAEVNEVLGSGKHRFTGIYLNENEHPIAGFLVPVFALNKQSDMQKPIAVLYGFVDASTSLFEILESKTCATKTSETMLVGQSHNLITYISPLADGSAALSRNLSSVGTDFVASIALRRPGVFNKAIDYSGAECLFTSRKLVELNMTLIQKICVEEALEESGDHQIFLFVTLFFALLLGGALVIAAWWYGSSVKEKRSALDLLQKTSELQTQTNLLNAINDNMTDFILLVDHLSRVIFANKAFAGLLCVQTDDLHGKTLFNIFGPDATRKIQDLFVDEDVKSKNVVCKEFDIEINGKQHLFYARCQQVAYEWQHHDAKLLTLTDVTLLHETQTQKDRLMKQIVSSLMRAIDLHDPYSANHSEKTATVALAVGEALDLPSDELATVEIAASLCNLGKLSIPRELLLKKGTLTGEEQKMLQLETSSAAEVLAGIDFVGPVLKTVTQKHEYLDGSGYPQGVSGEEIILPARILAAANAFVAMTSPRSYRDRLTNAQAMDQLLKMSASKYDRHVIAALFHVVENDPGAWLNEEHTG